MTGRDEAARATGRSTLSAVVLTRDEEKNLPRCLDSVAGLADQIVVVDSGSTDRTVAIARAAGARVLSREFTGFVTQFQFALEQATCDWILALDADEWLSPRLREAVDSVLAGDRTEVSGWQMERRAFVLGAWVRHGGWSEWKTRLVRRGTARWAGVEPHASLHCDGSVARLAGALCHRPYADLGHHLAKLERYATTHARGLEKTGRPPSLTGLFFEPPAVFLQRLLLQSGWRDGVRGVVLAGMASTYFFLRHARRWEARWTAHEPGVGDAPDR